VAHTQRPHERRLPRPRINGPERLRPRPAPRARAFFRADAHDLPRITRGHLDLLDRYDVGWRELRTYDPGHILYADDVQVVVEPWRTTC
jgi:hypothetical protein